MSKNLQHLRKQSLLKSKSYGLEKDYLWSLRKHPIITELGFEPPRAEVHSFKYEHEKDCADVFVALALTGKLYGWTAHKRISKGIIPDRHAWLTDISKYIERERGTQDKIESKTLNYMKYFKDTQEPFEVLYLVNTEADVEAAATIFHTLKCTDHYQVAVFDEFITDPVNCLITTARKTFQHNERFQ